MDGAVVESGATTVVCETTTVVTPSTLEDVDELGRLNRDEIALSSELDPVVPADPELELDADPDEDASCCVVEPVPVIDSRTLNNELELVDRFVEDDEDEELDIRDS